MTSHGPRRALFPGTFDPPTLGHLDLVRRGSQLFDELVIGVADHHSKHASLAVDERLELLEAVVAGIENVRVTRIDGLVVDAAESLACEVIMRGVRSGTDFDYEVSMARTNRELLPRLDTVLLVPDAPFAHVTSTFVRQIAALGGSIRAFVPEAVADFLERRKS